jgi:hypothetical protein
MITGFSILFGLLLGAVVGAIVFRSRRKARAAGAWPSTDGRVIEARVEQKTLPGDRPTIRFAPRIAYEYSVSGRAFRSTRVSFAETFWSIAPQSAQAMLARYPIGARVTVYYDPARPEEAVIERAP